MISYSTAINLIQQHTVLAATESCVLSAAWGRCSAADVYSRETLPAFDNSAMDGFAVCAQEATLNAPLNIVGATFAGEQPVTHTTGHHGAWKIMTGAPIPTGYDAVIPIEKVSVRESSIVMGECAHVGQHIRRRGEDFDVGAVVLPKGQVIQAHHIMALAATGHGSVPVYRPAQAVVFSTGNELLDDFNQPLAPGQIRNSNAPFLMSALASQGVHASYGGIQRDNADAFRAQLSETLSRDPDLILSSGAVSAGDADFIPRVIAELDGDIIFHKVAIKPGKPILFATFPNGTRYFGLPGNPISTAVGFRFFVQAYLAAREGLRFGQLHSAKLNRPLQKKSTLREFRKAKISVQNGELRVDEVAGQESHRIAPLRECNAWLVVEENENQRSAGESVTVAGWQSESLTI